MKHHFLLFRHCMRSNSLRVDVGFDGYSTHAADYVGDPMPDWPVPELWCTPIGLDLMEKSGAWLVDTGIVTPGAHVEIVSDSMQRDVDTALSISQGIRDKLGKDSTVSGWDLLRMKSFMFHPSRLKVCNFEREGTDEDIQNRLKNLRRPDLTFKQGLDLLEQIAGKGKVGSLVQHVPTHEPTFVYNEWSLTGAASLLTDFAQILFYSKVGLESSDFAPKASVDQVYQLLQFAHWFRSVVNVDNKWSATDGAAWANIILTVLSKGSLYDTPPDSDSVTIFVGHDVDLDVLSTALGASWNPPEYHTHAEFTPTPPGSGIHVVRDTETEEIQVSFVYPVYHKEGLTSWKTNKSGNMKQVPVIWKYTDLFESNVVPSIQDLESHFMTTLSKYPGATDCFYATTAEELNTASETPSQVATKLSLGHRTWTAPVIVPLAFVSLLAAVCIGRRIIRSFSHRDYSPAKVDEEGEYV